MVVSFCLNTREGINLCNITFIQFSVAGLKFNELCEVQQQSYNAICYNFFK